MATAEELRSLLIGAGGFGTIDHQTGNGAP